MQITKIEVQAKNKQKMNIFIDGEYSLSLSLGQVKDLGLQPMQELSDDDIATLKSEALFTKYYQKSLDYLAKRARSEAEIRKYIIDKSSKNQVIKKRSGQVIKLKADLSSDEAEILADRIAEHLKNKKFLDDTSFALAWVKAKAHKNYSLKRLKQELVKKGISSEIIESTLLDLEAQNTEEEALNQLVTKLKRKSRYQDNLKLKSYLVSKGFDYGMVKQVVDEQDLT